MHFIDREYPEPIKKQKKFHEVKFKSQAEAATTFFQAIEFCDLKLIREIISIYPKVVEEKNDIGETALTYALSLSKENQNNQLIELLLHSGSDPRVTNAVQYNALECLLINRNTPIDQNLAVRLELLATKAPIDLSPSVQTAFFAEFIDTLDLNNHEEMEYFFTLVTRLAQLGVSFDKTAENKLSLLHLAALTGNSELYDLFCQLYPNERIQELNSTHSIFIRFTYKNEDGQSVSHKVKGNPIQVAYNAGNLELAERMVSKAPKSLEAFRLTLCKPFTDFKLIKWLSELNFNFNFIVNQDTGDSFLHHLVSRDDSFVHLEWLLDQDANPLAPNRANQTPVDIAFERGNKAFLSACEVRGLLTTLPREKHEQVLELICSEDHLAVHLNRLERNGKSVIENIFESGNTEKLQSMLGSRPITSIEVLRDPKQPDQFVHIFQLAASHGAPLWFEFLKRRGLELQHNYSLVLATAISNCHVELIEYLLNREDLIGSCNENVLKILTLQENLPPNTVRKILEAIFSNKKNIALNEAVNLIVIAESYRLIDLIKKYLSSLSTHEHYLSIIEKALISIILTDSIEILFMVLNNEKIIGNQLKLSFDGMKLLMTHCSLEMIKTVINCLEKGVFRQSGEVAATFMDNLTVFALSRSKQEVIEFVFNYSIERGFYGTFDPYSVESLAYILDNPHPEAVDWVLKSIDKNLPDFSFRELRDVYHVNSYTEIPREPLKKICQLHLTNKLKFTAEEAEEIVNKLLCLKHCIYEHIFEGLRKVCQSPSEWFTWIGNFDAMMVRLELLPKLIIWEESKESTLLKISEQVIWCIGGLNPALAQTADFPVKLAALIRMVESPTDYELLFTAMQTHLMDSLQEAFECAKWLKRGVLFPSKALLKSDKERTPVEMEEINRYQSITGEVDLLEAQRKWFCYIGVFRSRQGVSLCAYVIKRWKTLPDNLLYALTALERIGIPKWNKEYKSSIRPHLIQISNETDSNLLRLKALKALCAIEPMHANPEILNILLVNLDATLQHVQEIDTLIQLIQLISRYEFRKREDIERVAQKLLSLLDPRYPEEVQIATVKALSNLPHEQGLIAAFNAVQGPLWERYAQWDTAYDHLVTGPYTLYLARPEHIHDGRAGMRDRILLQLASLSQSDPSFRWELEERYTCFEDNCSLHPGLHKTLTNFWDAPRADARHMGTSLFFPPNTTLLRGLTSRKGEEQFYQSVVDLFRHGCGSSALDTGNTSIERGSWNKMGQVYTTHNPDLIFDDNSTYFKGENSSALILIPHEYYQLELLRGEARIEKEESYNNIFYQGVPKHWIQAIYLSEHYRSDIELLTSDLPIHKVINKLTTPLFDSLTYRELVEIRRCLLEEHQLGYSDLVSNLKARIVFYPKDAKPSDVEKLIQQQGLKFSTEDEVHNQTLKWQLARQIVMERYIKKPIGKRLQTDDQTAIPYILKRFESKGPQFIKEMKETENTHGRIIDNGVERRVTVWEHTLEVINGARGSLGLFTQICRDSKENKKLALYLRLAALFHDSGKVIDRGPEHTNHSIQIARTNLSQNQLEYDLSNDEIEVVLVLIRYNDVFARYTHPKSKLQLKDITSHTRKIYKDYIENRVSINYHTFMRMLLSLYLADATTVGAVKQSIQIYKSIYDDLSDNLLEMDQLEWLSWLKKRLNAA